MEGKDTVMLKEQISDAKKGHTAIIQAHPDVYDHDYAVAEAQAEISFKAGRESILAEVKSGDISVNDLILSALKAGRKEVVEWLEKHYSGLLNQYSGINQYLIPREEREARLKEWGIEIE